MSLSKISQKEINKLRNLYTSKLGELNDENKYLKFKLEDKKKTLKLNQDILYYTFESILKNNENGGINENTNKIKNMIERSKTLNDKISLLINEIAEKEKYIYIMKKSIPETQEKIIEKIKILMSQSEQKSKEISSDEYAIKKLKSDLEKLRKNAFFKKARTEIYVAPPSKSSIEINLELIDAKNIFLKSSKLHTEKKKKSEETWREEKNLKEEMIKLKNSKIKENKISTEQQSTFLEEIGYNSQAEKYEKEEEEESEDSEDSSDDDSDRSEGDKKKKVKELKKLKEEYSKLEKKLNDYEKKINGYKKEYKDLKQKIEDLKAKQKRNS